MLDDVLFHLIILVRNLPVENEYEGRERDWSGTRSNQHLIHLNKIGLASDMNISFYEYFKQ